MHKYQTSQNPLHIFEKNGNSSPKKHLLSSKLFLLMTKLTTMKETGGVDQHQALGVVRRRTWANATRSRSQMNVAVVETLTLIAKAISESPLDLRIKKSKKKGIEEMVIWFWGRMWF